MIFVFYYSRALYRHGGHDISLFLITLYLRDYRFICDYIETTSCNLSFFDVKIMLSI